MRHMFWISAALLSTIIGTSFWPVGRDVTLPVAMAGAPPSANAALSTLIPATSLEVKAAVERVFGQDVVLFGETRPVYTSDDLNGDGVDDLAIMVTVPAKSVANINSELANWSIQDVRKADIPTVTGKLSTAKRKPTRVHANELLLAVIHGFGERAWRSAEAKQAFLLVNAGTDRLVGMSFTQLNALGVKLPRMSANPHEALIARSGAAWLAVYWTGAQYGSVPIKVPEHGKERATS